MFTVEILLDKVIVITKGCMLKILTITNKYHSLTNLPIDGGI